MSERYKILSTLGEGSFGKCYLVETQSTHERRVIKQIDLNPLSKEAQSESLREAKILEQLQHPNIITFHEVYKTKRKKLCIVMDYADGGDLSSLLRKQDGIQLEEGKVLDLFVQICLAIKHVHDRKILHRDLKAQNIFLMSNGIVKLGDFGIAKVLKSTRENAKSMVGTPYYLSPEIVQSRPYSFKSDIWSLGVLLYEMCALQPPFQANSIHGLALKIVQGQFPALQGSYSSSLKSLIGVLLNTNPEDRPTIHEVLWIPIIKQRIHCFLSETIQQQEFSHTLLHGVNLFQKPPARSQTQPPQPPPPETQLTRAHSGHETPPEQTNPSPKHADQQPPLPPNVAFFISLDGPTPANDCSTAESLTNQEFLSEYSEAATREEKRKVMLADIKEKKLRHSIKTEAFTTASDIQLQELRSSEGFQQAKEEKIALSRGFEAQAEILELQHALLEHPGEAEPVQMREVTAQPDREDEIPEVIEQSQHTSGQEKEEEMRAELEREMGKTVFVQVYTIVKGLEEHKTEEEPPLEFYCSQLRGVVAEEELEQRVIQVLVLLDLERGNFA